MNTDEIRARADAATPGPWKKSINNLLLDGNGKALFFEPGGKVNADFIAHAREDIPALLDALDAKERETAELREQLEAMTKDMKYVIRVTAPLGYAPCGICARINSGCSAKCTHDDYVDFEWRGAGKEKNDG